MNYDLRNQAFREAYQYDQRRNAISQRERMAMAAQAGLDTSVYQNALTSLAYSIPSNRSSQEPSAMMTHEERMAAKALYLLRGVSKNYDVAKSLASYVNDVAAELGEHREFGTKEPESDQEIQARREAEERREIMAQAQRDAELAKEAKRISRLMFWFVTLLAFALLAVWGAGVLAYLAFELFKAMFFPILVTIIACIAGAVLAHPGNNKEPK